MTVKFDGNGKFKTSSEKITLPVTIELNIGE